MRKVSALCLLLLFSPTGALRAEETLSKVLDRVSAGGQSACYVQGTNGADINHRSFSADNIGGISVALDLTVRVSDEGEARVQLKYMENGTLDPDGELLASANEINAGPDNRNEVLVKRAYFVQSFR